MCNEFVEGMGYLFIGCLGVGVLGSIIYLISLLQDICTDIRILEKNVNYLENEKSRNKKTR